MSTKIPDRPLLQWLDERSPDRGLHFAGVGDSWDFWSYERLADLTLRTSRALTARGIGRGDVVGLVHRSSPGFVAGFFGALAAGATACSVAPPFAFQRADEYARRAGHLFTTARPELTVCDRESLPYIDHITEQSGRGRAVVFEDLVDGVRPADGPARPAEHALLQFTSGSSGDARGVRVTHEALRGNVTAMRRWLRWTPEQPGIAWLPVHHDMGLVGCLINIVTTGCDGWMMQPEDFIRSPMRYLTCISEQRVRLAAMPNFGLAYILRRVRPGRLEGLRFDSLRSVILGAERIDPGVLRDFEGLLGPYGFDRRALLPAYGGAEATLAVTGLPLAEGWTVASPLEEGRAGEEVVGCGRPLDGVDVQVVDDDGVPVPHRTVGEIVVTGSSVTAGYVGDAGTASGTRLSANVLHTGDAGFLHEGQLFVIGRLGDGLKVHGRMVFAESLETQLVARGVPQRRAAVLLGMREGVPTAAVVMENAQEGWHGLAVDVLREHLPGAELLLVDVPRGGIAVTSSGKPRRRVMWRQLGSGEMRVRTVRPDAPDSSPPDSAGATAPRSVQKGTR